MRPERQGREQRQGHDRRDDLRLCDHRRWFRRLRAGEQVERGGAQFGSAAGGGADGP